MKKNIVCPFCGEGDFDEDGLKYHLLVGYCERFNHLNIGHFSAPATGFHECPNCNTQCNCNQNPCECQDCNASEEGRIDPREDFTKIMID